MISRLLCRRLIYGTMEDSSRLSLRSALRIGLKDWSIR